RREIDGDAARRQGKARCDQRRADPLTGLRHGLVGEADHAEGWQPGRDLHLYIDRAGLDSLKRDRSDSLDHRLPARRGCAKASGTRPEAQEHLQNKTTQPNFFEAGIRMEVSMVDLKTLQMELAFAR